MVDLKSNINSKLTGDVLQQVDPRNNVPSSCSRHHKVLDNSCLLVGERGLPLGFSQSIEYSSVSTNILSEGCIDSNGIPVGIDKTARENSGNTIRKPEPSIDRQQQSPSEFGTVMSSSVLERKRSSYNDSLSIVDNDNDGWSLSVDELLSNGSTASIARYRTRSMTVAESEDSGQNIVYGLNDKRNLSEGSCSRTHSVSYEKSSDIGEESENVLKLRSFPHPLHHKLVPTSSASGSDGSNIPLKRNSSTLSCNHDTMSPSLHKQRSSNIRRISRPAVLSADAGGSNAYSHQHHASNDHSATGNGSGSSTLWVLIPPLASVVLSNELILDLTLFILTMSWLYYLIFKPEMLYTSARSGAIAIRNLRSEEDVAEELSALKSLERRAQVFGFIGPFAGGLAVHLLQNLSNGPFMSVVKAHVFVFIALLRPFLLLFSDWSVEADALTRQALQERMNGVAEDREMKLWLGEVEVERDSQRVEIQQLSAELERVRRTARVHADYIQRILGQHKQIQHFLHHQQLKRCGQNLSLGGTDNSNDTQKYVKDSTLFEGTIADSEMTKLADRKSPEYLSSSISKVPTATETMDTVTLASLFSIEWPRAKVWRCMRYIYYRILNLILAQLYQFTYWTVITVGFTEKKFSNKR
eukprot:CFRG1881T1